MKSWKQMQQFLSKHLLALLTLAAMATFLILAWKQPYAGHSQIGNFDPFPDSLHYVVPARNLLSGQGFRFAREGGETKIAVPPIYSWTLLPSYLLNFDARSYYWSNLALGLLSIFLLSQLVYRLSRSPWWAGLILFAYVTNFVIYWQVSLPMAENALLTMLLTALNFALLPINRKNLLFFTIFAAACYGSKYVALPVTAALLLRQVGRLFLEKKKRAWPFIFEVAGVALLCLVFFNGKELLSYLEKFYLIFTQHDAVAASETSWFSMANFSKSFREYFAALMGQPIYNLWYVKSILPYGVAALVLLWSIFALWKLPKYRPIASLVLLLVVSQLGFLSLTAMIEGRYAFVFIPIIFTGLAACLGSFSEMLAKRKKHSVPKVEFFLSVFLILLLTVSRFSDLKTQLLLNYKGGESPWWQVGIVAADGYLKEQTNQSNTWVISSFSPFVWDFYQQGNYRVLPLSEGQSMYQEPIWGLDLPETDLLGFYKQALLNGQVIYLATVGFGRSEWPILEQYTTAGLQLKLIKEDCLGACKLYQLTADQN
jgi:hypothetical protein